MGLAGVVILSVLFLGLELHAVHAEDITVLRQYNTQTNYTGADISPGCFYCTLYPGYSTAACSSQGKDQGWNNGTRTFDDPLGPGYMIASIDVTLFGTFSCLPGGNNASLQLRLGDSNSPKFSAPPVPLISNCLCPNCAVGVRMTGLPVFPTGWPGYVYGGTNTLQIFVANHNTQDICLSRVNITLNAVHVFPFIAAVIPNLASRSSASIITITVDYLNPDQQYSCFFNGVEDAMPAKVINDTTATCESPGPSKRDFNEQGEAQSSQSTQNGISATVASGTHLTGLKSWQKQRSASDLIDTLILAPVWASPTANYNRPFSFHLYNEPVIASASPNKGKVGDHISIHGSGFVDSAYMSCRFDKELVPATFASNDAIECQVPTSVGDLKRTVTLTVSLNGQDFSSTSVKFYVETSASWWTPKRIAIVLGSVSGALLLIGAIIAVVVYRRKTPGDDEYGSKSRNGYRSLPTLTVNSVPTDTSMGIDMSEVRIVEKIGRGSFGDIYKAEWRGTEVAIKKIPFNSLNEDLVQEMLNEARIMESIRHPNVLSLMGCCPKPPEVCIIMEYMPRGSLYQILQDSRIPLSWQLIQRMALDAARGMNFLHQHNPIIMHRDLKSHNLLVDDAWRVKVADFGLSRMIEEKVSATMTVCGTPCWTAPEVLRNQRYSVKADVYSFGICLWELYTRTAPYSGMTPFQVMYGVASSGMRPPINDDCPEEWRALMVTCWSENPDERPTFDEVARTLQGMTLPETGGFH